MTDAQCKKICSCISFSVSMAAFSIMLAIGIGLAGVSQRLITLGDKIAGLH